MGRGLAQDARDRQRKPTVPGRAAWYGDSGPRGGEKGVLGKGDRLQKRIRMFGKAA